MSCYMLSSAMWWMWETLDVLRHHFYHGHTSSLQRGSINMHLKSFTVWKTWKINSPYNYGKEKSTSYRAEVINTTYRDILRKNWLVNPTGKPHAFRGADWLCQIPKFCKRSWVTWFSSSEDSESKSKNNFTRWRGKRCGFNFVGCALLDSLRLNLS